MRGELALEDVSFSYPSRPDASIFSKFSLTVPAGATVALGGQSGSGKSTVIQLVERFYDPLAGSVLLDGVDIRELQLEWLRKQIGLVSQEPVLFATSIRENILYGKPDASEEEVVAAAKAANAHGFISKLPAGYATLCGERGTQMSGGQKQRIAIARAIVKDPKVLLLDEATSALDAESERVVQEALDRLMEGRTTIVVAHRLSTVRNADTIAVVEKGRVAERGSYADLMAKRGAFAALVKLQQRA
jgi:ATP-binding cassette subfamily B (MDR/TAP) protein 1